QQWPVCIRRGERPQRRDYGRRAADDQNEKRRARSGKHTLRECDFLSPEAFFLKCFSYPVAVAFRGVAAEAEKGAGLGLDQLRRCEQGQLGLWLLERLFVDAPELVHAARPVGEAAGPWRAECAQMDVTDAVLIETGGEQLLPEGGGPGIGDISRVDDSFYAVAFQRGNEARERGAFIANGEEGLARHEDQLGSPVANGNSRQYASRAHAARYCDAASVLRAP